MAQPGFGGRPVTRLGPGLAGLAGGRLATRARRGRGRPALSADCGVGVAGHAHADSDQHTDAGTHVYIHAVAGSQRHTDTASHVNAHGDPDLHCNAGRVLASLARADRPPRLRSAQT